MMKKVGYIEALQKSPIRLVSFSGKKGSGKNYCADYLVKNHGFVQMSFAQPLKEICSIITNTSLEVLEDRVSKEEKDPMTQVSRRKIMQWVGTELFREKFGQLVQEESGVTLSLWVEIARSRIAEALNTNPNCKLVFTDARFSDELELLKSFGFCLAYLKRVGTDQTDTHASELGVLEDNPLLDHVITSDEEIFDKLNTLWDLESYNV